MIKNILYKTKTKSITFEETYSINKINFNLSHIKKTMTKVNLEKERQFKKRIKTNFSLINSDLKIYDCKNNSRMNSILIHLLIQKKKSHILTLYNEMQISLNQKQLMNRYYNKKESDLRLIKLENYYKHYIKFLAKPKLNNLKFNVLINENGKQKAQLYFNKVYGQKKQETKKIEGEEEGERIFNTSIKDSIDNYSNYSTTMTCDSNEQLIYPSEIYKKCNEYKYIINKQIISKKSSHNSIFSESINFNKSILLQSGDIDDCESLVNIIKSLKNKCNEEKENKIDIGKIKITQLKINGIPIENIKNSLKKQINKSIISNDYIKKISVINNFRNSFINTEKKSLKKKRKNVNKSQTIIHNNIQNIKINTLNTHSKLISDISTKNSINKNIAFNYNMNKVQNTRKKNLSSKQIFTNRIKISNSTSKKNKFSNINNIIIEGNKFIRTSRKNPTLKIENHKKLYTLTNLNENYVKNGSAKKNFFFPC